jgi:hypothetical protein
MIDEIRPTTSHQIRFLCDNVELKGSEILKTLHQKTIICQKLKTVNCIITETGQKHRMEYLIDTPLVDIKQEIAKRANLDVNLMVLLHNDNPLLVQAGILLRDVDKAANLTFTVLLSKTVTITRLDKSLQYKFKPQPKLRDFQAELADKLKLTVTNDNNEIRYEQATHLMQSSTFQMWIGDNISNGK